MIDESRCPICGSNNNCMNIMDSGGKPCWCKSEGIRFPKELIAQVPDAYRHRACICRRCAVEFTDGINTERPEAGADGGGQ